MEFDRGEDLLRQLGSNIFKDRSELAADEAWCDFRVVDVGKVVVDDGLRRLTG